MVGGSNGGSLGLGLQSSTGRYYRKGLDAPAFLKTALIIMKYMHPLVKEVYISACLHRYIQGLNCTSFNFHEVRKWSYI